MPLNMPDTYGRFGIRFERDGDPEPMFITGGYKDDSLVPVANTSAATINGAVQDASSIVPSAAALLVGWRYTGVLVYQNIGGVITPGEFATNVVGSGAYTEGPIPTNCALLVRKHSALAGRKGKGRFYAPPYALESGNTDGNGNILAVTVATLEGNFDGLLAAMTAADVPMQLLHFADPGPALPPTPVTGMTVQSKIATRRNRLRP